MKTLSNFLTNKNIVIIQSIWEKHINYVYRILNFIVNNDRKEVCNEREITKKKHSRGHDSFKDEIHEYIAESLKIEIQ